MQLLTIPYPDYEQHLPQSGRHILGQVHDEHITVYQAFNPAISDYAVTHQRFGGEHYSFGRMSWIKPNFLWMMYRAGWASKENQERILAIEIPLSRLVQLLDMAVYSSYQAEVYETRENWKQQLSKSPVRLQWDPDHGPKGNKLARRAIQLGIQGQLLHDFGTKWIRSIRDITPFVVAQQKTMNTAGLTDLEVIAEEVITIPDPAIVKKLMLDTHPT